MLAHSPCLVGAKQRAHVTYINGLTNVAYGLWERGLLLQLYFLVIRTLSVRVRILTSLGRNGNTTSCGFPYIYDLSATAKAYLVELGFCLLQLLQLVVVSLSRVPTCSNNRKSMSSKSPALVILYWERANMVLGSTSRDCSCSSPRLVACPSQVALCNVVSIVGCFDLSSSTLVLHHQPWLLQTTSTYAMIQSIVRTCLLFVSRCSC
jgi:hypothetical protein